MSTQVKPQIAKDVRDSFFDGYVEAMLWANTYDVQEGTYEGDWTVGDLDPEALARLKQDADVFLEANYLLMLTVVAQRDYGWSGMGHDLALTRNHHGAGFWDRGLGKVGEELTELAQAMGEASLYFDSGTVYTE